MSAVADVVSGLATALDGGPALVVGEPPSQPVPADVALVLRTSGSTTGIGRPVALSAHALRASADATHARLGGPGRWVLALPPQHIAGVQVLVRAICAGTEPAIVPGARFDPDALARTVSGLPDDQPIYLSLVPTQLHRLLAAGGRPLAALRRCSGILVGGAATSDASLTQARDLGLRVVTTYGMTETSGGCVYDGEPLPGVGVQTREGRILLGGPVLAEGYLDDGPQPFEDVDGARWFVTADAGGIEDDGRLRVLGRVDDVVITGGVNVHPAHVERLLHDVAPDVVIVGVPDPEWGVLVTAVVTGPRALRDLRDAVGGGPQAPRALVRVREIPTRGPGKPDRRAATALAAAALAEGSVERI